MAKPVAGSKAPDFQLPSADGTLFTLSAALGRPVVLYFYADDDTPGCTIENQEFTALLPEFERLGVTVAGISPDSVEKHRRFCDRHRITTRLLADPDHFAIGAYGVWGPKVTYGHHIVGLIRSTFLVDASGRIAADWRVTRIKGHAGKVLATVRELVAAN